MWILDRSAWCKSGGGKHGKSTTRPVQRYKPVRKAANEQRQIFAQSGFEAATQILKVSHQPDMLHCVAARWTYLQVT